MRQSQVFGGVKQVIMAAVMGFVVLMATGCVSMLASHPAVSEAVEKEVQKQKAQQQPAAQKVTPPQSVSSEPSDMPTFGDDDLAPDTTNAPTVAELESLKKNLFRYVKNMVATKRVFQANLSSRDEEIIEHLMAQDVGSRSALERSVLFIAFLEHTVVEYDHLVASSEENMVGVGSKLLAELSKDYGIHVLKELKTNGHLHHPVIYHMSFLVLHHVSASPRLIAALVDHLKQYSQAWLALHNTMEEHEQNQQQDFLETVPGTSAQENIAAAIEQQNALYDQRSYSMGEFAEGEELIRAAKELHSQNLYREAVEQLMQIPTDSPHSPTARELAQRYSDDAVEELRQQAAQLFQDHIKVNSLEKKISFLTEAQEKLQEAMAVYPDSRWQRKVQNNLTVIQQRLEEYERMLAEELGEALPEDS